MLKIQVTLKNNDLIVFETRNRSRAMEFRNRYLKHKFVKEIKTSYECK